jgi:hypothetical protein
MRHSAELRSRFSSSNLIEYLREFETICKTVLAHESGDPEVPVQFNEKNRGSKISWDCPFNNSAQGQHTVARNLGIFCTVPAYSTHAWDLHTGTGTAFHGSEWLCSRSVMQRIYGWLDIRMDSLAFLISDIRPDTGYWKKSDILPEFNV